MILGLACLALLVALAGLASGQTATTGQIAGNVVDPTGAVVSGATITLTNESGVKREIASDATGHYVFPLLAPGKYTLEASVKGFAPIKIADAVVKITETTAIDIPLKLASAEAQTVEVTAAPPLVQADGATTGRVIEQDTIRQLPLPTRNFQQLLTLTTGTSGSLQNSSELGRGDAVISVNGNRTTSNEVIINGVDASSIGTGSTPNLAVPATDSLQEFIVQTSLYDASQGRNTGGIVAAVTKSGTDKFHGNAYEFFRDDVLNGNNYFLNQQHIKRPVYERNQFGGTFGGPLKKERAWFFVSYQGTRETNGTSLTNSLATVFVPGNLTSDRSTAGINTFAASYGLPSFLVSPIAAKILQAKLANGTYLFPSSQVSAATNTPVATTIPAVSKFREDQGNANLDFKLSNANHLSLKAFAANNPTTQALYSFAGVGNALQTPGSPTSFNMHQRVFVASDTHIINSHMLNEARVGYSEISGKFTPAEPFKASDWGIYNPLGNLYAGAPTISIVNMVDLGQSPLADNYSQTKTYSFSDMVTWTHGRHTLKLGGDYKRQEANLIFNAYTRGQMYFADMTTFLMGIPLLSIMGSGDPARDNRANDFSFYLQDDWRVNNRLTINAGIRYDYFGQFYDTKGRFVEFDPTLAKTATIAGVKTLTAGFVQAGNGNLPGIPKVENGLAPADANNFGPRIGFAFRPFENDNRLVLRGGYGIYYDRPNARLLNSQVFNAPYYTLAMNIFTAVPGITMYPQMGDPFIHVPQPSAYPIAFNNATVFPYGGPPWVLPGSVVYNGAPLTIPLTVPVSGIYPNRHKFRTPYVQQFNFGMQWEMVNNLMLDLSYVGSQGRKLSRLRALNQPAIPGAAFAGPYSPAMSALASPVFSTFGVESSASSSYNSLQASLTKRYSNGLQFLASYTWSHSIDNYSGGDVNDLVGLSGNQATGDYRASSDFDRRHRFVVSFVYDLPKAYRGGSQALDRLMNNWEIAGIGTVQSGVPFSILGAYSAFANTYANLAPGRTIESAKKSGETQSRLNQYFDTSAFVVPTLDYGSAGRNILLGPGQKNLDFSVVKFIPIREGQKFEFRTEFFNLFNNTNFANPVNIKSSANFGQIVKTATGPRVIQFAFKYSF